MTTLSKVGGWAIALVAVVVWIQVALAGAERTCPYECSGYPFGALLLASGTITALALAGGLLVHGYKGDPAPTSTPMALFAKVGRVVAYASFPLAIASLALIVYVGPVLALVLPLWNVAAGHLVSAAARRLDLRVESRFVSRPVLWMLAVTITGAGVVIAGQAMG